MTQLQRSILSLALLGLLTSVVGVEAKLIPQRKKPVQRGAEAQAQKRVEPKIGCGATGGASKIPLLAAAYYGDIATLEKLLAKGTDVNLKDSYGRTALLVATNHAHTSVVAFLLAKGADVNVSAGGHTPLMYAACLADVESVKALLDKGADVNANDSIALVWIRPRPDRESKEESEQVFRLFLDKGVKVPSSAIIAAAGGNDLRKMNELLKRNGDTKAKNSEGKTALHVAAKYGSPEIAKALLAKGAAINEKNNEGMTPLMIAVEQNRLGMVEVLLNNGADVNLKDNDGDTALDYDNGDDKAITELLRQAKSGKKANAAYAADDVFSLVRKGDLTKLRELLKKNPSAANAKENSGATPLHYAAQQRSKEMVLLLIANKAEVNAKDRSSHTALHRVAGGNGDPQDNIEVIKVLLENGADPNANRKWETPFHRAIAFGYTEIVKLMLEHKADVTIKYMGKGTALSLAGNAETTKLLRAHGAK